jgi:tetratricopeptide (TPR) repeat protein
VSYFKWVKDFSAARNFNWNQVAANWDFVIWLDADDVIRGAQNLQEVASLAMNTGAESVFFNYLYQVETDGKGQVKEVLIEHLRERLIRNTRAYSWVGPIHETLIEQRTTNKTDSDRCDVVHLSDDSRREGAMKRNIEILEEELRRQGTRQDPRIIYYLGKAYFDLHQPEYYDKAEDFITRYLEGSDSNVRSGWEEERSQAWDYLGEIYRIKGFFNKAIQATANAMIESPKFPQTYIELFSAVRLYQV